MARYRKTEDGWVKTSSGAGVPKYTLAQYEDIKDSIPVGTEFIITDDYVDSKWYEDIEDQIEEQKQDLTHNYYTKTEVDAKTPSWGSSTKLGNITTTTQVVATHTGLIRMFINPSTANGAQARVNISNKSNYSVMTLDGSGCSFVAPCNKGDIITCNLLTGASNVEIYIIPFV